MIFIFNFSYILSNFFTIISLNLPKVLKSENAANYFLLEKFVNISVPLYLIFNFFYTNQHPSSSFLYLCLFKCQKQIRPLFTLHKLGLNFSDRDGNLPVKNLFLPEAPSVTEMIPPALALASGAGGLSFPAVKLAAVDDLPQTPLVLCAHCHEVLAVEGVSPEISANSVQSHRCPPALPEPSPLPAVGHDFSDSKASSTPHLSILLAPVLILNL
jgi:hypothetical protein